MKTSDGRTDSNVLHFMRTSKSHYTDSHCTDVCTTKLAFTLGVAVMLTLMLNKFK